MEYIDDYGDSNYITPDEVYKSLSFCEKLELFDLLFIDFCNESNIHDLRFNSLIFKLLGKRNLLSKEDEKTIIDIINKL